MIYMNAAKAYPEPGERTTESRKEYLETYMVKTSAFFIGAPGRSVQQITRKNICGIIFGIISKNLNGMEKQQP